MAAYFAALEAVLARRRLCVVLIDAREICACEGIVQASVSWATHWNAAIRSMMAALAVLVSTEADREVVIAAFWQLDTGFHCQVFTEQEVAVHWLLAEHARHEAAFYA